MVADPAELVTVSFTVYKPLLLGNAWNGFWAFVKFDGIVSWNSQSHVVIGQPTGAVDVSVNVTFRRGFPLCHVKFAMGAAQGVAVGDGLAVGDAVGVGPGEPVGVGVGDGLGVGAANGTVTVRMAVSAPPWLVTSSVMT